MALDGDEALAVQLHEGDFMAVVALGERERDDRSRVSDARSNILGAMEVAERDVRKVVGEDVCRQGLLIADGQSSLREVGDLPPGQVKVCA
jgi:hypothetical protein